MKCTNKTRIALIAALMSFTGSGLANAAVVIGDSSEIIENTGLVESAALVSNERTFIGQDGTFDCPNCGGTNSLSFSVEAGVVEIPSSMFHDQAAFDIEVNTILVDWVFSSSSIIDPLEFIFEFPNLADDGLEIAGAELDPSSTLAYTITTTANSVTLDGSGIGVTPADFVLVNVQIIPEPSTPALLMLCGVGLVLRTRQR